jgi:preprotein translocase subunit SecD
MLKKSIIAVLATVVVASVAAPAFASYDPVFDTTKIDSLNINKDVLLNELHARGIKATDVDAWGNLIRAEVTQRDGTQAVRFYTQDNFQPVNLSRTN